MSQLSYRQQTATGADINFTIDTFSSDELKVYVDGVLKTAGVHYNINPYNSNSQSTVDWIGTAPSSPSIVRIVRETDVLNQGNTAVEGRATYAAGSSVKADDLNNNQKQVLRSLQEHNDQLIQTYDVEDSAITTAKIKADNITSALIADDQIDSEHIVADSIDTEHYAPNSVDTTALAADAVTGAQIGDSQINSEHYVDGSIDREHLAADIVDGTKIADDSINSEHYVDGSIDSAHLSNSAVGSNQIAANAVTSLEILNGAVTTAKLAADAVDGTKLADNAVNSEHYTDGSIDRVHLEADIIDGTKLADNAVNSEHIAADAVTQSEIAANAVGTSQIIDGEVNFNKLTNGAVGTIKIADDAVTADKIADAVIVTNSEQAAHSVNDTTFFTTAAAEARYFNASTGETIKDGQTFPDNDTTIATTAAINDRIIDLVDDVGGFVPIANETSFPNTNPDVNNGTGTIVSISTLASNHTSSGSGVITISNGTVGNSTVTINGAANSTTYSAGYGLLVETTTTLNTYTFHRLVPKATEVTTVAGKATEIGRLGTADAVADMAILGTADVVADLNTLGTADVVSDMNTLGTADVVADMNTLAVTSVVNNMDTVAGAVTNVNNVGGSITNVNTTAGSISNVNTVAGSISNVNTVGAAISNVNTTAGSISNVNTVASNISSVNSFANTYRIGANNPTTSLDVGDLFFNTTSDSLKVYTGSAWVDGVTTTGDFALKTGNTFTGSNLHNDNVKSIYGTGSDFQIYHDNGKSYLKNTTLGSIFINSVSHTYIANSDNTEYYAKFHSNGSTQLFYDNTKRLETDSNGATVTGRLTTTLLTTGGTSTFGGSLIFDTNNTYDIGQGGTRLRHIYQEGNHDFGDNAEIRMGNLDDFKIFHNGASNILQSSNGNIELNSGSEYMVKAIPDGAVELYHNNNKKLETTSGGATVQGQLGVANTSSGGVSLSIGDNAKAAFGVGDDLQIYHDATNSKSIIDNNTGDLYLQTTGSGDDILIESADNISLKVHGSEDGINITGDGSVQLYHNGSEKLVTTSSGATVTGSIVCDTNFRGGDTVKLSLGDAQDLEIDHNGTNNDIHYTTGNLLIRQGSHSSSQCLQFDGNGHLYVPDNEKIYFGASADLVLFHDGTSNYISSRNGNLYIEAKSGETAIQVVPDGAVDLRYNGVKKLETTSSGVQIPDDQYLGLGNSDDLNLRFLNGTGAFIQSGGNNMYIRSNLIELGDNSGNKYIKCVDGAQVELYHGVNSKKLETSSGGGVLTGTWLPASDATGNFGSTSNRWGTVYATSFVGDGSNLTGITSVGGSTGVAFNDNVNITLGTGNDTLIRHVAGSHTEIEHSGTGDLVLETTGSGDDILLNSNDDVHIQHNGEDMAQFRNDGEVSLYYDNARKLSTTSTGIEIPGNCAIELDSGDWTGEHAGKIQHHSNNLYIQGGSGGFRFRHSTGTNRWIIDGSGHYYPAANNTYDIGTTSYRVRNIYTNDLHLSNEGSSNDVDGTWGDWTMQEGESDLFLKNNRSGKKYKFNLTEVS